MHLFARFVKNPKTTLGGTAVGAMLMSVGGYVISQAGCDFSSVQWGVVLSMLFAGPQIVGGSATDNGKSVTP